MAIPIYQNVWATDENIYHTTPSGVDVYNSDASVKTDHIALPSPASAVWANESYVYMGTLASGVYRAPVSGTASPYLQNPSITSDFVMYLHGAGDYLCITTTSGVDRYNLTTSSGIYTTASGIHKCYQTTSGTVYYLENNLFFGVDESATGLDGELWRWQYYSYMTFAPTTVSDTQIMVVIQYDFPYERITGAGDDIRFLDPAGHNLSYYIKNWYPNATIIVDLFGPDTTNFYMLYGNSAATAQTTVLSEIWNNETSTGEEYLLWDLIQPKLHAVYTPSSNWSTADYIYDEFYGNPLFINDIHVTEETSSYNNDNTIFLATERGAFVIEERQGDEENANRKRYYIS